MNIETGQDPGSWTRKSRWMNRIQLSDEGEDKEKFVEIALMDQHMERNNLDDEQQARV